MTTTDEKDASPASGNELVAHLQASGSLDELFAKIDSGEVAITGSDGLLPALLKTSLERGLQAALSGHLGYEKGEHAPAKRPNAPMAPPRRRSSPRSDRSPSMSPATEPARSNRA